MKIKSIRLKNFKRFTDLEISGIPATVKLVIVVGPNGSGKSSLFDAFINWYRNNAGFGIDNDLSYFRKEGGAEFNWQNTVIVESHGGSKPAKGSLYVRTAYRNDAEFSIKGISKVTSPIDELRVLRSIQNDQTVSQNYQRLVYETISGVYDPLNDKKSVENLRNELIGGIRSSMRAVFGDLMLSDIADPLGGGTFFFEKGATKSYQYKNLSGGEKAAFDLLLDLHMKKKFYPDAIWCIDELETHLHTRVQGTLMKEMFALVPDEAQMWITTHSLGVMRAAQEISIRMPGSVAVLDFDGVKPDEAGRLVPSSIGRVAWEKMLSVAIDDISSRIVPSKIVVCEGSSLGNRRKSFDAEIYNRILGATASDIIFVSGGSSNQVANAGSMLQATLDDVTSGSVVLSLCDRDDKSDAEVANFEGKGNVVLPERNLESYLFADDVLLALATSVGKAELVADALKIKQDALNESIQRGNKPDDMKSAAGKIFIELVKLLSLVRAGNDKDAFMRDTLAPLILPGTQTHNALKAGILDRIAN